MKQIVNSQTTCLLFSPRIGSRRNETINGRAEQRGFQRWAAGRLKLKCKRYILPWYDTDRDTRTTIQYTAYPQRANFSNISLKNVSNRLHEKQNICSARRVTRLAGSIRSRQDNRELKQRCFWATHVNRKCTFCIIGQWFYQNFRQILLIRGRTLSSTIVVAFRHVTWEKTSLPVDYVAEKRLCLIP